MRCHLREPYKLVTPVVLQSLRKHSLSEVVHSARTLTFSQPCVDTHPSRDQGSSARRCKAKLEAALCPRSTRTLTSVLGTVLQVLTHSRLLCRRTTRTGVPKKLCKRSRKTENCQKRLETSGAQSLTQQTSYTQSGVASKASQALSH